MAERPRRGARVPPARRARRRLSSFMLARFLRNTCNYYPRKPMCSKFKNGPFRIDTSSIRFQDTSNPSAMRCSTSGCHVLTKQTFHGHTSPTHIFPQGHSDRTVPHTTLSSLPLRIEAARGTAPATAPEDSLTHKNTV